MNLCVPRYMKLSCGLIYYAYALFSNGCFRGLSLYQYGIIYRTAWVCPVGLTYFVLLPLGYACLLRSWQYTTIHTKTHTANPLCMYMVTDYLLWCAFFFCRLNEYRSLLKSLKSRRDFLYARLSEVLVAKVW